MFDKEKLQAAMWTWLVLTLIAALFNNWQLACSFLVIGSVAGMLYQAARPALPTITRGLFADGLATSELRSHIAQDPEMRSALEYVYGLSPTDFMRFTRLAIELRDEASQRALKEASTYYRSNKKDQQ